MIAIQRAGNLVPRSEVGNLSESGVHLFRVDYGYPDVVPPGAESWLRLDLVRQSLWPRALAFGQGTLSQILKSEAADGITIKGGERLLAWRRLRGRADLVSEIASLSNILPIAVQCRFPRHYRCLRKALEVEGAAPISLLETPIDGSLPPVYRFLGQADLDFACLHAELEWISAISAARGESVLDQIGLLLSLRGPVGIRAISGELGVTEGAAGSYLKWMADVALVRREGSRYDLSHLALSLRFAPERYFAHLSARAASRSRERDDDMSID